MNVMFKIYKGNGKFGSEQIKEMVLHRRNGNTQIPFISSKNNKA